MNQNEQAETSYQAALAALNELPDSKTQRLLKAQVCRGLSDLIRYTSPQQALVWLKQGLLAVGDTGAEEKAMVLLKINTLQIHTADYAAAQETLFQVMPLIPPHAHWLHIGVLLNQGMLYRAVGDISAAIESLQDGLGIARRFYNYFQMVTIWNNLGNYRLSAGDWPGAVAAYQETLALSAQLGSAYYQTSANLNIAFVYIQQGDYEQAETHLTKSMELASIHSIDRAKLYIHSNLADLYVRQQRMDAAETHLAEAERLALQMESQNELVNIYRTWSQWHLLKKDLVCALDYGEKAHHLACELTMPLEEGLGLRALGCALLANAQTDAALDAFAQSWALLEDKDPYEAARTQHQWGLALHASGDMDESARLLESARATFERLGAKRDLTAVDESLQRFGNLCKDRRVEDQI